jgi:hypothetical protein
VSHRRAARWLGGCRKADRHALAGIEQVERTASRLDAGADQRQAMDLHDHEIRRDQRHTTRERLAEEAIGLGMVPIVPGAQRDPRPAIDEQSCGSGCASDTVPAARQRTSR